MTLCVTGMVTSGNADRAAPSAMPGVAHRAPVGSAVEEAAVGRAVGTRQAGESAGARPFVPRPHQARVVDVSRASVFLGFKSSIVSVSVFNSAPSSFTLSDLAHSVIFTCGGWPGTHKRE